MGIISHIPWMSDFIVHVVNPGGRGLRILHLAEKMVGQRLKAGSMTKDNFYYIVGVLSTVIVLLSC